MSDKRTDDILSLWKGSSPNQSDCTPVRRISLSCAIRTSIDYYGENLIIITENCRFPRKIGRDIRHEEQVYKAELEDRLSKGLTGDDAIQHYNDWMEAAGQSHLKITDYGHLLQKL